MLQLTATRHYVRAVWIYIVYISQSAENAPNRSWCFFSATWLKKLTNHLKPKPAQQHGSQKNTKGITELRPGPNEGILSENII